MIELGSIESTWTFTWFVTTGKSTGSLMWTFVSEVLLWYWAFYICFAPDHSSSGSLNWPNWFESGGVAAKVRVSFAFDIINHSTLWPFGRFGWLTAPFYLRTFTRLILGIFGCVTIHYCTFWRKKKSFLMWHFKRFPRRKKIFILQIKCLCLFHLYVFWIEVLIIILTHSHNSQSIRKCQYCIWSYYVALNTVRKFCAIFAMAKHSNGIYI